MKHASKKVYLHAGDFFFGSKGTHIHTLLGSCVSITLWHPTRQIGGMCHFALPQKPDERRYRPIDARYCGDCIALFQRSLEETGTKFSDYQVKIFGGGNLIDHALPNNLPDSEKLTIGEKNVTAAFEMLTAAGGNILVAHVGEFGYRRLAFDLSTGDVWVKFTPFDQQQTNKGALNGRS